MSFVLLKNNEQVTTSKFWNPVVFGNLTNTSFPLEITEDYIWENDGYWLGWIPDPEPPAPTPEQKMQALVEEFTGAVQNHLDAQAISKGYDNIVSACSYAGAPNPFQAESIQFITWRGNVWAYCYQELAKVQSGERLVPELQDFLNELPTFG